MKSIRSMTWRAGVVMAGVGVFGTVVACPPAIAASDIVPPKEWLDLALDDDVVIEGETKPYNVFGTSVWQVNESMNTRGPRAIDSKRAIGSHGGGIGISYTMLMTPGTCSLYSHTVTYRGETVLPRWRDEQEASDATARWWKSTLMDIREHEQEHAFLSVIQAIALDRIVENLPSQGTCDAFSSGVKRATDGRADAGKQTNKTYDNWTNNGTTGPYWLGEEEES